MIPRKLGKKAAQWLVIAAEQGRIVLSEEEITPGDLRTLQALDGLLECVSPDADILGARHSIWRATVLGMRTAVYYARIHHRFFKGLRISRKPLISLE